jgi:hypothetical protein
MMRFKAVEWNLEHESPPSVGIEMEDPGWNATGAFEQRRRVAAKEG